MTKAGGQNEYVVVLHASSAACIISCLCRDTGLTWRVSYGAAAPRPC